MRLKGNNKAKKTAGNFGKTLSELFDKRLKISFSDNSLVY